MRDRTIVFLGVGLIVAIVSHGAMTRYSIGGASQDGQTAWIVDGLTGRVTYCGSPTSGVVMFNYVSQLEASERAIAERNAGTASDLTKNTILKKLTDVSAEQMAKNKADGLATLIPKCAPWSAM